MVAVIRAILCRGHRRRIRALRSTRNILARLRSQRSLMVALIQPDFLDCILAITGV